MSTILANMSEVKKVTSMKDFIGVVEKAFRLYGEGKVQLPAKSYLYFKDYDGDLRAMPTYIKGEDMDIAGIKSVNVHPGNPAKGLPTVMAVISLTDPKTGYTLALMDGTYVTAMRTGAAGGVATKYLSKEDSKTAAFIGCGAQANSQLEAIMEVRPGLQELRFFDVNTESSNRLGNTAKEKYNKEIKVCQTVEEAVRGADIVTTVTPVRNPVVKAEWISPGTHINAIGADAEGKQELESGIIKNAKVVIDDWAQASHSGEINVPLLQGVIKKEDVHAELGNICAGKSPGRENNTDITVFDSTGLAIQDVSSAYMIYNKLKDSPDARKIDFMS